MRRGGDVGLGCSGVEVWVWGVVSGGGFFVEGFEAQEGGSAARMQSELELFSKHSKGDVHGGGQGLSSACFSACISPVVWAFEGVCVGLVRGPRGGAGGAQRPTWHEQRTMSGLLMHPLFFCPLPSCRSTTSSIWPREAAMATRRTPAKAATTPLGAMADFKATEQPVTTYLLSLGRKDALCALSYTPGQHATCAPLTWQRV